MSDGIFKVVLKLFHWSLFRLYNSGFSPTTPHMALLNPFALAPYCFPTPPFQELSHLLPPLHPYLHPIASSVLPFPWRTIIILLRRCMYANELLPRLLARTTGCAPPSDLFLCRWYCTPSCVFIHKRGRSTTLSHLREARRKPRIAYLFHSMPSRNIYLG